MNSMVWDEQALMYKWLDWTFLIPEGMSKDEFRKHFEKKYITPVNNFLTFVSLMDYTEWDDWEKEDSFWSMLEKINAEDINIFSEAYSTTWMKEFWELKHKIIQEKQDSFFWIRSKARKHLQDVAREAIKECETKYGFEGFFERNQSGKIVFRRKKLRDFQTLLEKLLFSKLRDSKWVKPEILEVIDTVSRNCNSVL